MQIGDGSSLDTRRRLCYYKLPRHAPTGLRLNWHSIFLRSPIVRGIVETLRHAAGLRAKENPGPTHTSLELQQGANKVAANGWNNREL